MTTLDSNKKLSFKNKKQNWPKEPNMFKLEMRLIEVKLSKIQAYDSSKIR
jgi:hypothetical protein